MFSSISFDRSAVKIDEHSENLRKQRNLLKENVKIELRLSCTFLRISNILQNIFIFFASELVAANQQNIISSSSFRCVTSLGQFSEFLLKLVSKLWVVRDARAFITQQDLIVGLFIISSGSNRTRLEVSENFYEIIESFNCTQKLFIRNVYDQTCK